METIKVYLYQRFHLLFHVLPAPYNGEQLRGGQKSDSSGKKKKCTATAVFHEELSEADKSEILGGRASDCSYLADSSPLGNFLNWALGLVLKNDVWIGLDFFLGGGS